jgi:hypothetical protein
MKAKNKIRRTSELVHNKKLQYIGYTAYKKAVDSMTESDRLRLTSQLFEKTQDATTLALNTARMRWSTLL